MGSFGRTVPGLVCEWLRHFFANAAFHSTPLNKVLDSMKNYLALLLLLSSSCSSNKLLDIEYTYFDGWSGSMVLQLTGNNYILGNTLENKQCRGMLSTDDQKYIALLVESASMSPIGGKGTPGCEDFPIQIIALRTKGDKTLEHSFGLDSLCRSDEVTKPWIILGEALRDLERSYGEVCE